MTRRARKHQSLVEYTKWQRYVYKAYQRKLEELPGTNKHRKDVIEVCNDFRRR
jgi:hypothetical protein